MFLVRNYPSTRAGTSTLTGQSTWTGVSTPTDPSTRTGQETLNPKFGQNLTQRKLNGDDRGVTRRAWGDVCPR
jgi:hypothetical protein